MAYLPFLLLPFASVGGGGADWPSSRSRPTVRARARSFFNSRSFLSGSVWPIDIWNRSRNICSFIWSICWPSSLGSRSRNFWTSILVASLARHELARQRQLLGRETHRLGRDI